MIERRSRGTPRMRDFEIGRCACGCPRTFQRFDRKGRERRYAAECIGRIHGAAGHIPKRETA